MSAEPTAGCAARVPAAIFAGEALILLAVALLCRSDRGDPRRAQILNRRGLEDLREWVGTQFDSRVVAAFLSVLSAADAAGSVPDANVA
jgi:hypothetical protein